MPQSVAQLPACSECGSEALGQALFCFNCGSRLSVEEFEGPAQDAEIGSEAPESVTDRPIAPPAGDPFEREQEDGEKDKPDRVQGQGREPDDRFANTASAISHGEGLMRMRRIETRWTPDDQTPNLWFILAAAAFVLVAFGIFLASMYLR